MDTHTEKGKIRAIASCGRSCLEIPVLGRLTHELETTLGYSESSKSAWATELQSETLSQKTDQQMDRWAWREGNNNSPCISSGCCPILETVFTLGRGGLKLLTSK